MEKMRVERRRVESGEKEGRRVEKRRRGEVDAQGFTETQVEQQGETSYKG